MKRLLVAALLIPAAIKAAPNDPGVRVEPQADAELRRMSGYLSNLKSFRVKATSATDLVTPEGQKVQVVVDQKLALKRPNRFRTERIDPKRDVVVRFDGRQLSIFGKRTGYYALAPLPPNLTEAVDTARERYGLEAPAADLFLDNSYDELMQNVVVGRYIGLEPIDGVLTHHLAFEGKDVDWQIWIQDGPQPVPRRYVITSKKQPSHPQFITELSHWEPNVVLSDNLFVFEPPPGSKRIEFQPLGVKRSARGGAR